jgi:hypothetical protein
MIALRLAATVFELSLGGDMSAVTRDEIMERFESLRSYGKLPRGRERQNQRLTNGEIAAAILGLVPPNPKWAGHAATILCNLCTVGGVGASFYGTTTLQEAIERVLGDSAARKAVVRLSVSGAECGINSSGSAMLVHETAEGKHRVFYVPKEAVSQLQPGMEQRFDLDSRHSFVSRELSFNGRFFERIAKAIELTKAEPSPPEGDGSAYAAEEAREARFKKLGAGPGSRFLNVGVENQVTWPMDETVVQFDQYKLVLMPKTRESIQSIHVDLSANKLTDREAITVINRFLSVMTWCDDQFAVAQDGWSGNPVPVPVRRRDLAFTTTRDWMFNRKVPTSEDAKRALAIYREARNAQQNFMVSYAVLNYFKVIEIRHKGRGDVINWFRDNFDRLRKQSGFRNEFEKFAKICGNERPQDYIYKACRVAVSHARKDSKSDPDDANELVRLHTAADVLHLFARDFIASQFGISDVMYSGN